MAREIDARVHRDDDDVRLVARRQVEHAREREAVGGRVVDQLAPDRGIERPVVMWHLDAGSRHVPFCVMSGADRATSRESDVMPPSIADLLATGEPLVLPGVYDALSARLAAEAGFRAVFLSGFAMAATRLGRPDIGLLTQTEVLDTARLVCAATPCPVIVDIDTGWGGPLNVERSVTELLRLGAAGCFLEDQEWPKRCGHMEGKRIVALDEYLPKLRAALRAREGAAFHVTARTDARAVAGLDEADRVAPARARRRAPTRCSSRRRSRWSRWTRCGRPYPRTCRWSPTWSSRGRRRCGPSRSSVRPATR